jgi:hypothetical protein
MKNEKITVLTESHLLEWANHIKAEKNLTLGQISADISPVLGKTGKPYSTAYISNALNQNDGKTSGVSIAMAVITRYTGVKFETTPYFKIV